MRPHVISTDSILTDILMRASTLTKPLPQRAASMLTRHSDASTVEVSSENSQLRMVAAIQMEQKVRKRTGSRIENLLVVVEKDQVELFGTCESFYAKQLAQSAILEDLNHRSLINRIEVVNATRT